MDKNPDAAIWRAVAALARAFDETAAPESLDAAADRLRRHLLAAAVGADKEDCAPSCNVCVTPVTPLLGSGISGAESVLSWLTRIGALTQNEAAVVRRSRIVVVDGSGRIVIGKPSIGVVTAATLIAGASFLSGVSITCVLIFPTPPAAIPLSFALGVSIGWAVGRIVDLSFRAASLRTRILLAAPWLDDAAAQ